MVKLELHSLKMEESSLKGQPDWTGIVDIVIITSFVDEIWLRSEKYKYNQIDSQALIDNWEDCKRQIFLMITRQARRNQVKSESWKEFEGGW